MTTIGIQPRRVAPTTEGFIKRHPALTYFMLAFAISWGGVLTVIGPSGIPAASQEQLDALLPLAVLAMIAGPTIAGILLTGVVDGRAGLRDFRSRLLRWRVERRWYAVALLLAPIVATAVLLALSRFSSEFLPAVVVADDKVSRVVSGIAMALAAGIFEELGWTGFAVPALRRRYGILRTGLTVGLLWGAWHLLVNVWASRTFTGTVPLPLLLTLGLFTELLVFRVLMVWVYDRTGSLLIAILMHASLTACARILNPQVTGGLLLTYGIVLAAAFWVVVAAVASANGGTLARRPAQSSRRRHDAAVIEGHVSPGFEAVGDAFAENFSRRHELGGACCVYLQGEKVVDVWGGVRNKTTGEPWEADTMVVVYSATKGMAAMTLAVAHSRGWLDYDECVSKYWPEFAQHGKASITARQLLAHQAGLFAFDESVDANAIADLDRLAVILARQKPAWEPGTRQAYHALTLGFYENELLRRVDPQHRSLGRFFDDEIATPLGLDFYIRLPESIPNSKLATLAKPNPLAMLFGFPPRLALAGFNRRSNIYRALVVNPGSEIVHDARRVYARNLEVPSGGGVGTARAMAHAYGVFATRGHELELSPDTLQALSAPAIPATHGFFDEALLGELRFSLGFMKPSPVWPFGSASSFGSPGSGGSLGFADPEAGIGYGYVTSQMGTTLTGDPRDLALRNAVYSVLSAGTGGRHAHTPSPRAEYAVRP